ncbi:MAG: GcrA family cell cycle regulator [Xanthobacteraceae bacterium]|jgi:GcrA cell cycle regulator
MFTNRATWSSERIDQLKRCFQAGLSSSQIAREMGVTRNAVIGKMNRLGLSRPKDALAKQHHEQKRAAKLARPRRMRMNIFAQRAILTTAYAEPLTCDAIPIHEGRGCTLLELSHGKCRWPIDAPGADDVYYCGNEPLPGLPYCAGHARIAYRPVGRLRNSVRA